MKITMMKGNVLWREISSIERERKDGTKGPIYVPLPGVRVRLHIESDEERENLLRQLRRGEADIYLPYIKEMKEIRINERLN